MILLKYLLAMSMIEMIEFKGLETKSLEWYTPYDKIIRNRRQFDYDYENWEKNMDSYDNFKLITRKYEANGHIFNTVNAIYDILRENDNVTTFNKGIVVTSTLEPTDPTYESKLTEISSVSNSNTNFTANTASIKLFKPDLTTLANNSTSILAKGSITTKNEPESTTITSISTETPTVDESLTKLSIISTDSTNTGETTRDWKEIIDFTIIPEDTVDDLLIQYAKNTTHVTETTLKPPPTVNPTEFLYTTNKFFDATVTTIVTKNPYLVEIEEEIQKTKDGFFTSSLIVLLKTLVGKNDSEVGILLNGMDIAIVSMRKENSLSMFKETVLEVFQSVIQMLSMEPPDVRKDHLTFAISALEHRRTFLGPDINTLITVVDTVYIAEDVHEIADFIRDEVAGFPNKTKSSLAVARQAIELFIIIPHRRVKGTAKETLLMMGLTKVIKSRMLAGPMDRRRVGDEKNSGRRINGQLSILLNKEATRSLRHYNHQRKNKMTQKTLLILPTRKKWDHTFVNNENTVKKVKSVIDIEKLYSIKSYTKPTPKYRRKHPNKQDLIDRKKHHTKINATETYKLKRKNTNTQAITENTKDSYSVVGQDSETSSFEDNFDANRKISITENNNKHKDPRLSLNSNNNRIQNDNHSIELKAVNDFSRNEKRIINKPIEKNNIKDKLVDWMNKYTNVIYRKLKNGNMHHGTNANLRHTFKRIAQRKTRGSHRRKLNRYVFNTPKLNNSINDVVQKKRKPMTATSYEYDEENILRHKILKAIQNTSLRDNSNLTNRKKLQKNEVIKAELIKLIRINTNIIKQKLYRKYMATTNTYMKINSAKPKRKSMKETSYEIDEEIDLKNKILAAMKKDSKTAVTNGRPTRRYRKNTEVYSNDEEEELKANLYALLKHNSRVSRQSQKTT